MITKTTNYQQLPRPLEGYYETKGLNGLIHVVVKDGDVSGLPYYYLTFNKDGTQTYESGPLKKKAAWREFFARVAVLISMPGKKRKKGKKKKKA